MTIRKKSGHPAKQDPDIAKLFKTMRSSVELVKDLEDRLSEENFLKLKASALGLMFAYSQMTGMTAPDEVVGEVFETVTHHV